MFENFENFKKQKAPIWAIPLLLVAISAHLAFGAGIVVKDMMAAPLLTVPPVPLEVAVAPPPPPPPPPPKGGKKLEAMEKPKEPRKIKVTETVQPVKPEEKDQKTAQDTGADDAGEEGGEEGGEAGGVVGGVVGGVGVAPPPPPPPPPAKPQTVAPTALEQQRIGGDKNILPDDVTKTEIQRSGKTRLNIPVKVCIDKAGGISSVNVVKSSGFAAYDAKLNREIRKWKYRPFMINNTPAPVCAVVLFVYNQK